MDEAKIKQANEAALKLVNNYLETARRFESIGEYRGRINDIIKLIDQEYEKRGVLSTNAHAVFNAAFVEIMQKMGDKPDHPKYDNEKELSALLLLTTEFYSQTKGDLSHFGPLAKKIVEEIKNRILKAMDYWLELHNRSGHVFIEDQFKKLKEFILLWVFADFSKMYPRAEMVNQIQKPVREKEAKEQEKARVKFPWVFNYFGPGSGGGGDFR